MPPTEPKKRPPFSPSRISPAAPRRRPLPATISGAAWSVPIAHGYFDINLDVVWETVQTALPELLRQLPAGRQDADDEDRNDYGMEP